MADESKEDNLLNESANKCEEENTLNKTLERSRNDSTNEDETPGSPHFEPVVRLPLVIIKTHEEGEEELLKLRAKLFRYDRKVTPAEWKERGTGDVKILKNSARGTCRIVMRRDKTLKLCANHNVVQNMELKPSAGSDKAWVWSTLADYADEEPKTELLAIRFANAENAQKFKEKFEEAREYVTSRSSGKGDEPETSDDTEKEIDASVNSDTETEINASGEGKPKDEVESVAQKLQEIQVQDSAPEKSSESTKD